MTATATPQPISPPPSGPPPARPNSALRAALLLIGTVLLIGLLVPTGVRLVALATHENQSGLHQITDEVDSVSLRTVATDVQVRYADVDQVEFEFTQHNPDLILRHSVRGEELSIVVERPGRGLGILTPSLSSRRGANVEVTLPRTSAGADLDLRTTAGDAQIEGDFGGVSVNSTAADLHLTGSAGSLQVDSTATDVIARDLAVSGPVRVDMTAGMVNFHGTELPSSINVGTTATDVLFELPAGEYEIRTSTTASTLTQDLSSTVGAERIYEFRSTAGDLHLRERP